MPVDFSPCTKGKFCKRLQGFLATSTKFGILDVDTEVKVAKPFVEVCRSFISIDKDHSHDIAAYPIKSKADAFFDLL